MQKLLCFFSVFLTCYFMVCLPEASSAELNLNLIAVNPSETEPREIDVKYYLPKELEPTDVLDAGEMSVNYDVDKSLYFVSGKVKFSPKESKTFKIRVRDVWVISDEEISALKQNMEGSVSLLKSKPEIYENAQREMDQISQQLEFILNQQKNYSDNIDRRIEQYRAYAQMVEKIRQKIYDPTYFDHDAQVKVDNDDKTVKFVLQVQNPSDKEEKTIKHKHFLPAEVREEDIVEKRGFDVRFDEKKDKSYLVKEDTFKPSESKNFEIVLKDIWRFPVAKLDPIEQRARVAMQEIKDSSYATSGQYLFDDLTNHLELIRSSQNSELSAEQHIGIFRTNEKRYEKARQDVERIEQMLAIVKAKKLEELEVNKVQNILKKLQALRGLQEVSNALLKKKISVTNTWKIIAGAILFIAFFTSYHFFVWAGRSGKMGEELGLKSGETLKVVAKKEEKNEEKE